MQSQAFAELSAGRSILTACAWGVHLYTAMGAVVGLLAIHFASIGDYRSSFVAMAITIIIDSSDGSLARLIEVKKRIPGFDGALLDNIVDYLTYVIAPVFLMVRARLVQGNAGLAVACFVLVASAYQFCQTDAKTPDDYFLGFPSYWNLVVFYLYCLGLSAAINEFILAIFALLVFVPIKYIYPSRTKPLRAVTLSFGVIWAGVTIAILPHLPHCNPLLLYSSLAYVAYYFVASFALQARSFVPARQ